MNANELADLLDFDAKTLNWKTFADAATMLRQQQAEIEALKTYKPNQTLECSFDLAGFKPPAKTLTDEEIWQIIEDFWKRDWTTLDVGFARAILRKAQEK